MAAMSVAGILLGLGEGRRFGGNKLAAQIDGRRLVDIACAHFLEAGLNPVVFVGTDKPSDPRVVSVTAAARTNAMIDSLRLGLDAVRARGGGPANYADLGLGAAHLAGGFCGGPADRWVGIVKGHIHERLGALAIVRCGDGTGGNHAYLGAAVAQRLLDRLRRERAHRHDLLKRRFDDGWIGAAERADQAADTGAVTSPAL